MNRTRTRTITLSIALASLVFAASCSKEEAKAEPPAPVLPGQSNTTTVQAAPGTQVQTGGTQVKAQGPNGATVQVQGAGTPVVVQNGANVIKVHGQGAGKVTEMTAEDGRKVVVQGDKMVAVDPSRPGARVEINGNTTTTANGVKIEGNKVTVPGVGVVTTTP